MEVVILKLERNQAGGLVFGVFDWICSNRRVSKSCLHQFWKNFVNLNFHKSAQTWILNDNSAVKYYCESPVGPGLATATIRKSLQPKLLCRQLGGNHRDAWKSLNLFSLRGEGAFWEMCKLRPGSICGSSLKLLLLSLIPPYLLLSLY